MKYKWLLITIMVLAAVLRLYGLTKYPDGLNADEAALGYNAYSLLLTGKDEHGHYWPVNLESFADYKPALYAYLIIPLIKVLGLTDLAVRLPSALAGIVAVLLVYLLVTELMGTELKEKNYGLAAAAMLALSPWHLKFSRGSWETNLATTLILAGAWLMVKWLKSQKGRYLIWVATILVVSMYTYQSARLVAPLLAGGWVFFNWQRKWLGPTQTWMAVAVAGALLLPLVWSIVSTSAGSRLVGVGLLADVGPVNRANELRGQHQSLNSSLSRMLHNRWVLYTVAFFKNYSDHFGGDFLFVNGDMIERYKIPETGLLYLTDVVLVVVGLVWFIRRSPKYSNVIWWWLLIAPVASALTFQTPNAHRSENMVIPIIIIGAVGLVATINFLRKQPLKYVTLTILVLVYAWQIIRHLHQYYVHYPKAYPMAWDYGFRELVDYVHSVENNYAKILVTDKYDQPYILFLYYLRYSPEKFQDHHELTPRDKFNFSTVRDFYKYHFESTPWEKVRDIHSSLIVAAPEDIPDVGVNIVKTIYFPGGKPAFKIISN